MATSDDSVAPAFHSVSQAACPQKVADTLVHDDARGSSLPERELKSLPMPLEPILPTAIRWGIATVLIGPLVLSSLLRQVAQWTAWDPTAQPGVLEWALTPYVPLWLLMLFPFNPMAVITYTPWSDIEKWFLATLAYFVAGALLPVGIDRVVSLLHRIPTPQIPKKPPQTLTPTS